MIVGSCVSHVRLYLGQVTRRLPGMGQDGFYRLPLFLNEGMSAM